MFCFQGSYQRNPPAWSLITVLITQAICWWSENCRFVWENVSLLWMQFTAHRKRCSIHRITSVLYHITRTNVGVFPAILPIFYFSLSQSEMTVSSEWSVFHSAWGTILLCLLANHYHRDLGRDQITQQKLHKMPHICHFPGLWLFPIWQLPPT